MSRRGNHGDPNTNFLLTLRLDICNSCFCNHFTSDHFSSYLLHHISQKWFWVHRIVSLWPLWKVTKDTKLAREKKVEQVKKEKVPGLGTVRERSWTFEFDSNSRNRSLFESWFAIGFIMVHHGSSWFTRFAIWQVRKSSQITSIRKRGHA